MNNLHTRFHLTLKTFSLALDLQLPATGISAIFGVSGCGKTTFLRCIAGLEKAAQGYCAIGDTVWQDSSRHLFLPAHQREVGYVFQESCLFPHLSVKQNLNYGLKRSSKHLNANVLTPIIDLLGIGHLLDRMPAKLSGGEKQRVAIARALAVTPRVLLMDEPLAALDLARRQEILPYLARLPHELQIPIVYVTHSPQEVTQLADYLVVLEAGQLKAAGRLEETLTNLESPLAVSRQASSIIQAQVCGHEAHYYLTLASFSGGVLSLPYQQQKTVGTPLRLRIYARDVSLSLQKPQQTSILNILRATIAGIIHDGEGRTMVRLRLGDSALLAHISYKSACELGLQVGMAVFAQVKATAIL